MNKRVKIKTEYNQEYFAFSNELYHIHSSITHYNYSIDITDIIVNIGLLRGNYCLVRHYYDSVFVKEKQYVIQIYDPVTKRIFNTEFTISCYIPEHLFLKNKILRKIKRYCKYYKIVKEHNLAPVDFNCKTYL